MWIVSSKNKISLLSWAFGKEMKDTDKWPFYNHIWPFFCQLYVYLSQNWGSDSRFEMLFTSKSYLVQKLWHKTQKTHNNENGNTCILCHKFWTNQNLEPSKWLSEPQFCERWIYIWQKMAGNGRIFCFGSEYTKIWKDCQSWWYWCLTGADAAIEENALKCCCLVAAGKHVE